MSHQGHLLKKKVLPLLEEDTQGILSSAVMTENLFVLSIVTWICNCSQIFIIVSYLKLSIKYFGRWKYLLFHKDKSSKGFFSFYWCSSWFKTVSVCSQCNNNLKTSSMFTQLSQTQNHNGEILIDNQMLILSQVSKRYKKKKKKNLLQEKWQ